MLTTIRLDMNERIRELAEQAGHRYYPSSNSGPLRVEYLTPELEKFAELIVRECARIVNENDCEGSIVGDGMLFEHFGVEE
jgi:hypothetical protein